VLFASFVVFPVGMILLSWGSSGTLFKNFSCCYWFSSFFVLKLFFFSGLKAISLLLMFSLELLLLLNENALLKDILLLDGSLLFWSFFLKGKHFCFVGLLPFKSIGTVNIKFKFSFNCFGDTAPMSFSCFFSKKNKDLFRILINWGFSNNHMKILICSSFLQAIRAFLFRNYEI